MQFFFKAKFCTCARGPVGSPGAAGQQGPQGPTGPQEQAIKIRLSGFKFGHNGSTTFLLFFE